MWNAYAQYTYDYYSISLFAETVLHVGQVPMLRSTLEMAYLLSYGAFQPCYTNNTFVQHLHYYCEQQSNMRLWSLVFVILFGVFHLFYQNVVVIGARYRDKARKILLRQIKNMNCIS